MPRAWAVNGAPATAVTTSLTSATITNTKSILRLVPKDRDSFDQTLDSLDSRSRGHMPLKNSETSERTANALNFVFVETLVDAYALQVGDAHLKLVLPLISKRSFNRKAALDGNHTEVQVTIQPFGSNSVKYITNLLLRAAKAVNPAKKI